MGCQTSQTVEMHAIAQSTTTIAFADVDHGSDLATATGSLSAIVTRLALPAVCVVENAVISQLTAGASADDP
jgi:hypothetical protein